jgi:hypothetical protein
MPMRSVPPPRTSSVWWLAAVLWWVAVAWCCSLSLDSSSARPPISSIDALLWRRIHPLPLMLQAAMEVDEVFEKQGGLVPADGFGADQQRRLICWSYGASWLPVFHAAPLLLLAERRLSISSQLESYRGGSCVFFLEFKARCCCDGLVAPSGASPVTVRLHLGRRCFGPDCNFHFQFRVLLAKVRDLDVISLLCESLCVLCTVCCNPSSLMQFPSPFRGLSLFKKKNLSRKSSDWI